MNAESSVRAEELSQHEAAILRLEADLQAARDEVERLRSELDARRTDMQSTEGRPEGTQHPQAKAHRQAAEADVSREAACGEPSGPAPLDASIECAEAERGNAQDESISAAIEQSDADQDKTSPPGRPATDEEESVEEYMAALLQRMRGADPPPADDTPDPQPDMRRSDRPNSGTQRPLASREDVPIVPMSAAELLQRAQSRTTANLSAMRELANVQARQAIDAHGKRRSLKRAYGTLGTSAACFLVGFIVLAFSGGPIVRTTAGLIVIVGIYCLGSGVLATREVVATMRRKKGGLRAILEEVEAELAAKEREAPQNGGTTADGESQSV